MSGFATVRVGVLMRGADVYLQPHAADPVLSEQTVLELARAHVPQAQTVTGVDESGGEARVYFVDGEVVVKTQRPPRLRPRTSLAKEVALLGQLAERLSGRVPAVLGYGHVQVTEGAVEYVCMTRMPGRAAVHRPGPVAPAVLHELGDVLHTLHTTDVPAQPALIPGDTGAADLRARLERGFAGVLDRLAALPTAPGLPVPAARLAERALSALPLTLERPLAVLHSNPGPTHTFVADDGTFTGLIDFGDAYCSHPALDLVRWPRPADRQALLKGYLRAGQPDAQFQAVWTVAMVQADLAVLCDHPHLAGEVADDLTSRLAEL
jgi:hygromycin-B 7''-O-kinase